MSRLGDLRDNSAPLVAVVKPHKPVSPTTVGRWIKEALKLAGIDTAIFKAHSTRSASTSKAAMAGIPTDTILKVADWSKTQTFQRYYNRSIQEEDTTIRNDAAHSFASGILRNDIDMLPGDKIE